MRRFPILALVLAFAGCVSDGTSPSDVSIDGHWRFEFNMFGADQGPASSCRVTMDFSITQTGNSFSGVQLGDASAPCSFNGVISTVAFSNGTIVDGHVSGRTITFDMGGYGVQHSGTVAGPSITGTAQWAFVGSMNGSFNAVRF